MQLTQIWENSYQIYFFCLNLIAGPRIIYTTWPKILLLSINAQFNGGIAI